MPPAFDPARATWLATCILPHEPALRRWLLSRRNRPVDVDDLVQESYALIAGLKSIDHITNPKAYFFQTAKSLILMSIRKAKVVAISAVDDLDWLGAADELSPERQVSGREELRLLSETLAQLPRQCQEAFSLRKVEGMPQKQIAVRLGLTEKAVEKQVARAVRLLMDVYGRGGNLGSGASMASNTRSRYVRGQTRS